MKTSVRVGSLLAIWLLGASALDSRADGSMVWAIRDARIVPVSGPVLAKGSIVLRDGLIESLGSDVGIPPDARVLEGAGLTVYPGLIDSLTDIALPTASAVPAQPGRGEVSALSRPSRPGQPTETAAPREKPGVTPYLRAADLLVASSRKTEEARNAGITTVLTAPARGIFAGQSAVINLGDDADRMVIRTPVALHVGFSAGAGFREFPGSLMGALAYISQTLMDARHYRQAWEIYSKNLRGLKRPATNRVLEALQPVVDGKLPVVLPASSEAEVLRAVTLAERQNLRLILRGAQEAHKAGSLLKARNIPLIVSLKFPEKESDVAPDYDEGLRSLKRRIEAPRNIAELHKAGLRFAFYSDGMANPRDFVRNAGRSVQAGLPADAALRALTLGAAEILGVEQQVGSLEKGKIANLVVTDGDLFGERTRIRYVFVDGQKYDVPAAEERRATQPATVDVTGRWDGTAESSSGPRSFTIDLDQEGEQLKGKISSPHGGGELISGSASGDQIRFSAMLLVGERQVQANFVATLEGDTMKGTVTPGQATSMPFTAKRGPR